MKWKVYVKAPQKTKIPYVPADVWLPKKGVTR